MTSNIIRQLINNIKISDIIKNFIEIQQKGNNFFAVCPFHKENTASFVINDQKKMYYCFGCHKKGDVINFLMEYKKFSFNLSIKYLSEHSSIQIITKKYTSYSYDYKNRCYLLLEKLTTLYKNNLKNEVKNNSILKNFILFRKLNNEVIEKFKIGFALNDWRFILKRFKNDHQAINILIKLGMIIKKENVSYDKFRNRIIFPITNVSGQIIGFGGRILNQRDKPKYLNSSESILFIKHKELYGLYEARKFSNGDTIIIVEGYLDVISMHKIGIYNVASTLGTSFSHEQYNKLKKYYSKILICFDGDTAGQNAAFKIAEKMFVEIDNNIYLGFITLPHNSDPDSLINNNQSNILLKALAEPLYIVDFIFEYFSKKNELNSILQKIELFKTLSLLINKIENVQIKKILLDYYYNKIIKKKNDKIIYNKNQKILSLGMKGCIFLLKKRNLEKRITEDDISVLEKIKDNDIKLFLDLIKYFKNDKNFKPSFTLLSKININNSLPEIINKMSIEEVNNEFDTLIKKIKLLDL